MQFCFVTIDHSEINFCLYDLINMDTMKFPAL